MMTPHGPDTECFDGATNAELKPAKIATGTMAFMFESSLSLALSRYANNAAEKLDDEYYKCWSGLKDNFKAVKL
jgi:homogentisate 1,2-dioxygenase